MTTGARRLAQRRYPRGHAHQTELSLSASRQARQILPADSLGRFMGHHGCLFIRPIKRVGTAAKHKRLRSIRMTSTISTMTTTVPIPIYIENSFPGSAGVHSRKGSWRHLQSLGSIQLPAHETLKPRRPALQASNPQPSDSAFTASIQKAGRSGCQGHQRLTFRPPTCDLPDLSWRGYPDGGHAGDLELHAAANVQAVPAHRQPSDIGVAPIAVSSSSPRARSGPSASTSVRAHWYRAARRAQPLRRGEHPVPVPGSERGRAVHDGQGDRVARDAPPGPADAVGGRGRRWSTAASAHSAAYHGRQRPLMEVLRWRGQQG